MQDWEAMKTKQRMWMIPSRKWRFTTKVLVFSTGMGRDNVRKGSNLTDFFSHCGQISVDFNLDYCWLLVVVTAMQMVSCENCRDGWTMQTQTANQSLKGKKKKLTGPERDQPQQIDFSWDVVAIALARLIDPDGDHHYQFEQCWVYVSLGWGLHEVHQA